MNIRRDKGAIGCLGCVVVVFLLLLYDFYQYGVMRHGYQESFFDYLKGFGAVVLVLWFLAWIFGGGGGSGGPGVPMHGDESHW